MSAEHGTSGGGDKTHYKSYKFVISAFEAPLLFPPPPHHKPFLQILQFPHVPTLTEMREQEEIPQAPLQIRPFHETF